MKHLTTKPINEYVEYQLEIFREECNFSDDELKYFNYKAKNMTVIQICDKMMISQKKMYDIKRMVDTKMKIVEEKFLLDEE